jgi:hypothetical protein
MEFESKIGPLEQLQGDHPSLLEVVEFLRLTESSDGALRDLRDPLIGRPYAQRTRIHDGNGRLLSCAYAIRDGQILVSEPLIVWVGYLRNPQATGDKAYENACNTVFAKTKNERA